MPDVTYTPDPGDPVETEMHGVRFRANVPTSVPEDHLILRPTEDRDGKPGPSLVDGNRFFALGDGKRGPGRPAKPKPPSTPEEYFPYAVAWIKEAKSSGEIESRWANEEPMRKTLQPAWGSSDDDKLEPIKAPAIDILKRRERQ